MNLNAQDIEKVKKLISNSKQKGYITQGEILEIFPEIEENLELLEYIVDKAQEEDLEIIDELENWDFKIGSDSTNNRDNELTLEEKINILRQIRSHISTDPMRAYLQEVGRIPLLNAEEEVVFARKIEEADKEMDKLILKLAEETKKDVYVKAAKYIEKGNSKVQTVFDAKKYLESTDKMYLTRKIRDGIEAKHLLVTANLRLVVSIAKTYVKRGLDFLDLIQEGNLGLMRAVDKFEYRKGFKFSTYATWWIRQAITRALADQSRTIRIPVHMNETINKLSKVSYQLATKLGRKPTTKEIAEAMNLTEDKVLEIYKISQKPHSLESTIGDNEEGSTLAEVIADEFSASPQDLATWSYLKRQINEILMTLTPRERKVLELRFGLKDGVARTLEEVGREFKVTRERIRQIESKALRKIKSDEIAQALKDYLT